MMKKSNIDIATCPACGLSTANPHPSTGGHSGQKECIVALKEVIVNITGLFNNEKEQRERLQGDLEDIRLALLEMTEKMARLKKKLRTEQLKTARRELIAAAGAASLARVEAIKATAGAWANDEIAEIPS